MKRVRIRRSVGFWMVVVFFLLALIGPWIAPHDPAELDLYREYAAPGAGHWLGTTDNGVDVLSALLYGARLAALIGTIVIAVSVVAGTALGTLAGYHGGWMDQLITGAADFMQAFPRLILYIAVLALVARPGVTHVIAILCINGWVLYTRIARAETLALREREFVQAARALGLSTPRILARHIVPNLVGPLIVQASAGFGVVVLMESTLSFLGLGPGTSHSWGALIDQGTAVLLRFPHVAIFSGAAIALTVLAFNRLGDDLRDRLDPKAARRAAAAQRVT